MNMLWLLLIFLFVIIFLVMILVPKRGTTKAKGNLVAYLFGIMFFVMGASYLYVITEELTLSITDIFSDVEHTMKLVGAIGIFAMGIIVPALVFFSKSKTIEITVKEITTDPNTFKRIIFFDDESINQKNILVAMIAKHFVFVSKDEKFRVGKTFRIDLYKYGSAFENAIGFDGKSARSLSSFHDSDFIEVYK